jgi:hypothetical protein
MESPKSVLAPIWAPNTGKDRMAVLSVEAWTVRSPGPNGPQHGAASPPLRTSRRSAPGAQTVCDGAKGILLCSRPRSRLPGEIPSGRRDPRVCLGVSRPHKTSLVNVESKRGEDLRQRETKLELLLMHKVKIVSRFDLIDCGGSIGRSPSSI